jgi:hypothetical protein
VLTVRASETSRLTIRVGGRTRRWTVGRKTRVISLPKGAGRLKLVLVDRAGNTLTRWVNRR